MASAEVGDDGFGDDPTVAALEARYAELVGKPSAVLVPSGVMANQIALRVLTRPGDAVVAGRDQPGVSFEMGAAARNSSIQFATVDDSNGRLAVEDVLAVINAEAHHRPHVSLVVAENTHMPSGGTPWDVADLRALASAIGELPLYLDGARLFNAVVATGTPAEEYAAPATLVMSCLTKGLGAPVGSLLAGPPDLIGAARVERKRMGGAMHQAGILAAAGLVALDTMIDRLADDHSRARALAELFASTFPEAGYDPRSCRTNIVAFNHPAARVIVDRLIEFGVLGDTIAANRARFVTHVDITDDDIAYVGEVLEKLRADLG